MTSRALRSALGALALTLGLTLSASADELLATRAHLEVGPFIGGQDLFVHLRTQEPGAFAALFLSFDGTPTILSNPFLPPIGLNVANSIIFFRQLDASGRDLVIAPSSPGQFGFPNQNTETFLQYMVQSASGPRFLSNRESVDLEPSPVFGGGFLDEQAASRLPVGYDQFGGNEVIPVDLDRDGDQDLVVANEFEVRFWINDGTGVFTDDTAARFTQTGEAVGPLAMADVNGDTHPDLVVGGGFDDFAQIADRQYLNDGNGAFTLDAGALPMPSGLSGGFEFGDVDGDGDLDLAIAAGQGQHLPTPGGISRLLINDGFGNWTEQATFSAAGWQDTSVTVTAARFGDIDNDGDLDLLMARIDTTNSGAANVLLANDGNGNFSDVSGQLQPGFMDNSQDADFADIDLDGYLDLIVANSHASIGGDQSGDIYFNQGAANPGVFVEDDMSDLEGSTPADFIRLTVEPGDLDGDGDVDLLIGVHDLFFGANQLLLLNQGGIQGGVPGKFVRQTWYDPGDFISYGVEAFDFDNDGDLDVLQMANGVVTGDPLQQFQMRLFENQRP